MLSTARTTTRLGASRITMAPAARRISASAKVKSDKPLYASQNTIPHLPVPRLSSTLAKYLETILPLQTREDYAVSARLIREFGESDYAATLQKRLEDRAAERPSWLSEWWNDIAYMGYRGRIVPEVNYFYIHKRGLGKGASQTERAAALVRAIVEFKKLVDSEQLEPEKGKSGPLCMSSYKYLFNSIRVPTKPADVPKAYAKDLNHIVVLRNDNFYKVEVGGRSASEIAKALEQIKQQGDKAPGSGLGVLCADNRDVWTDARNHLLSISAQNKASLEAIESAILLVCLDDGPSPKTDTERAWSYWAGGLTPSAEGKGRNRFFDKHELIVDEAGESGFNGEHSMLDGTPTLRLNEFILASIDKGVIPLELPANEQAKGSIALSELKFDIDAEMKSAISKSRDGFAADMAKQDLEMVAFTDYGKSTVKKFKISPDAWSQMVKQLAYYRLKGKPGVTYESCQTRKFLLGRTEVIRTVSNESRSFVEAMEDPKASDAERAKRLRAAAARHGQYSAWAADAQGVDRHLFGLKMLVKDGEEVPAFFKDPIFAKSSHWDMSTSNLGSKFLDGWGYGEVVADGYGMSYAIDDDKLCWGITTMNGDAKDMAAALAKAATDMRTMMESASKAPAKL